jgi:hypothetical protein
MRDDCQAQLSERQNLGFTNLVGRLVEEPGKIPSLLNRKVRGK